MAKIRYCGVYNITMTSRITCVYREQWYVIITFDLTWTQSVRPSHAINLLEAGVQTSCPFQYNTGPSTLPCGTPLDSGSHSDLENMLSSLS